MTLLERFLKYAAYDTGSDHFSQTAPSTEKQKDLGRELVNDMGDLGVSDARMNGEGVVYGSIPASPGYENEPSVGLIAHMDTSPEMSGKDVRPRVIENYGGEDIEYPNYPEPLSPKRFPDLAAQVGKTLIVTDGGTLLGADDKAGIAEILQAVREINERGTPHGKIALCFTPDEEVGRGADHVDLKELGADFAYTVDGDDLDCIEYECFNAAALTVTVRGFNIHPGSAKNQMKNASLIAFEYDRMLPEAQRPQYTEGYEGFFHLSRVKGDEETAELSYLIRDHDKLKFGDKKRLAARIGVFLNDKYGAGTVQVGIKDSYYNMLEMIKPHMYVVERAKRAMRLAGIEPREKAIRGGTDGARFSYMGLACPNLPTGGRNFHGRFEYISLEDMEKAVEILVNVIAAPRK